MATTTNMLLEKNDAGATDWVTDLEANLVLIDAHDHSTGKGAALQGVALSVKGRAGAGTGAIGDIVAASGTNDGHPLRFDGASLNFGALATAGIADDAVTPAKVGAMVPAFLGRQGGSATDWRTTGTTDYESGINVRMQCGAGVSDAAGHLTVTFPVAFASGPIVLAGSYGLNALAFVNSVSATQASFNTTTLAGVAAAMTLFWLATGPE